MPRTSTGNWRNATAFLKRFGRAVRLADGSTIMAIFKTQYTDVEDEVAGNIKSYRRYSYRLWVSAAERDEVASNGQVVRVSKKGTFSNHQNIVIDGQNFYVNDYQQDSDDWIEAVLSHTGPDKC